MIVNRSECSCVHPCGHPYSLGAFALRVRFAGLVSASVSGFAFAAVFALAAVFFTGFSAAALGLAAVFFALSGFSSAVSAALALVVRVFFTGLSAFLTVAFLVVFFAFF